MLCTDPAEKGGCYGLISCFLCWWGLSSADPAGPAGRALLAEMVPASPSVGDSLQQLGVCSLPQGRGCEYLWDLNPLGCVG